MTPIVLQEKTKILPGPTEDHLWVGLKDHKLGKFWPKIDLPSICYCQSWER